MSAALHPVSRQILDLLERDGCWRETFHHEAVRTSEEAAAARPGYGLNQGAKAIILRVKRGKRDKCFVMLVFPADRKFDSKRVKAWFKARDIRFASQAEVSDLTGGVQPGGVPPFGSLFDLPVYAAPELCSTRRPSSSMPATAAFRWRCARPTSAASNARPSSPSSHKIRKSDQIPCTSSFSKSAKLNKIRPRFSVPSVYPLWLVRKHRGHAEQCIVSILPQC